MATYQDTFVTVHNQKKLWWSINTVLEFLYYALPEMQSVVYQQPIDPTDWEFYQTFAMCNAQVRRQIIQACPSLLLGSLQSEVRRANICNLNGLAQNMNLVIAKLTNGQPGQDTRVMIKNYYSSSQKHFTFNKHILLELRSLFGRMNLCANQKIIMCKSCKDNPWAQCDDCNDKHQFLTVDTAVNTQMLANIIYCDDLIESIRPLPTQFKNEWNTPNSFSDCVGCVAQWITDFVDESMFLIQTHFSQVCMGCKTVFHHRTLSHSLIRYAYHKHCTLLDFLMDTTGCTFRDTCHGKCKKECNVKIRKNIKTIPKQMVLIDLNKMELAFESTKQIFVSHSIEYPLIIDFEGVLAKHGEKYDTETDNTELDGMDKQEMVRLFEQQRNRKHGVWIEMIVSYMFGDVPQDITLMIKEYAKEMQINRFCQSIYSVTSKQLFILSGVVVQDGKCNNFCLMDVFNEDWNYKVEHLDRMDWNEQFIIENSKWYYHKGGVYDKSNVSSISIYDIPSLYSNTCTLLYRHLDAVALSKKPELSDAVLRECQFYYS
eukprot:146745_1